MSASRYLVGYRPHERGQDALSLGVTLAQSFGAGLDLVFVVREHSAFAPAYPPVGREEPLIARQAREWLEEAAAGVPDDVEVAVHVRYGPSVAEGLMATADELGSALIVIGSGGAGLIRRHELGDVASTLLHHASRPVTLVPRAYRAQGPIEQIDVAVGLRTGGQALLDEAVKVAARRDLPLRLITMVDIDSVTDGHDAGADDAGSADAASAGRTGGDPDAFVRAHVDGLLDRAVTRYGHPASTRIVTARGGIRTAIEAVDWDESSILLVGASRLAQPRRFFLGSTVHAMLRALTVPVVAVPAGADDDSTAAGTAASPIPPQETP